MKRLVPICVACALLELASSFAHAQDLSTDLMNSTVKVSHDKAVAAAFLLSRPTPDNPQTNEFVLVTAAHVLEGSTGESINLVFRRQVGDGIYKKVPTKLFIRKQGKGLWTRHPAADIAVMPIIPPAGCEVAKISVDLLATDETLKKNGVHPGDTVHMLGYPHRIESSEAGFPVLRSGAVASFPLTPTKTYKTFLASINSFEGDSGGPVYMAESNRSTGDKNQNGEVRLILGLVSGQHFIDEEAKLVYEAVKVRHRLGLAIVVPAALIKETIEMVR